MRVQYIFWSTLSATGGWNKTNPTIIHCYMSLAKSYKPNFVASHLRALCNQWCTSRRFQSIPKRCPFCHLDQNDSIEHCLECNFFQSIYHPYFQRDGTCFTTGEVITFGHIGTETPSDSGYYILYVHIAYLSYNSCAHGQNLSRRLLVRHLKTASEHCPKMRRYIADMRSSE